MADPVSLGLAVLGAGYNYYSSKKARDESQGVMNKNIDYAQKRLSEAKQTTKFEKAALANLRKQMDDPTRGKEVLRDTSKVLADRSNVQRETYLGQTQGYMDDSLVAKKISQEIDIESNKKLVDLAEQIALKNQQARIQLSGKYADTQLQIGQRKENRVSQAEDMLHQARQGKEIRNIGYKKGIRDSFAQLVFSSADFGHSLYAQNQFDDAYSIFSDTGSSEQAKSDALATMLRYGDNIDLQKHIESIIKGT